MVSDHERNVCNDLSTLSCWQQILQKDPLLGGLSWLAVRHLRLSRSCALGSRTDRLPCTAASARADSGLLYT